MDETTETTTVEPPEPLIDVAHAAAGIPHNKTNKNHNINNSTSKTIVPSEQFKRAVDWKLFELISLLIDEHVNGIDFEESIQWFQPKHAEEVIEERTTEGFCGYPLCSNPLPTSRKNNTPKYRIDYYEKKIYEIEKSIYYCCSNCLEKSEIWIKQLDSSLPYSRTAVTKQLNIQEYSKATIDDVLYLLDSNSTTTSLAANATKSPTKPSAAPLAQSSLRRNEVQQSATILPPLPPIENGDDPPPLYFHPSIDDRGTIKNVNFQYGKPVILPSKEEPKPKRPTVKASVSTSAATESKSEAESTAFPEPALPKPFIPKKVSEIKTTTTQESQQRSNNTTTGTTSSVNAITNTIDDEDINQPYQLPVSSSLPPQRTEVSVTIDEIMRTMKELQIKHGLTAKSTVKSDKIANKTLPSKPNGLNKTNELWNQELTSIKDVDHEYDQDDPHSLHLIPQTIGSTSEKGIGKTIGSPILPSKSSDSQEDNSSINTGGEKKKSSTRRKSVEWNLPDDTKQLPPSELQQTLSSFSKDNNTLISRGKSQSDSDSPVSGKLVPKGNHTILGLTVKEHTNVAPLSVKAILTKKEPDSHLLFGQSNAFEAHLDNEEAQFYSQHIEGHYYQN